MPAACQRSSAKRQKACLSLCKLTKSTYQHTYNSLTNMLYLVCLISTKAQKVNLVNLRWAGSRVGISGTAYLLKAHKDICSPCMLGRVLHIQQYSARLHLPFVLCDADNLDEMMKWNYPPGHEKKGGKNSMKANCVNSSQVNYFSLLQVWFWQITEVLTWCAGRHCISL